MRRNPHRAVTGVYDDAGNAIERHENANDFKEWSRVRSRFRRFRFLNAESILAVQPFNRFRRRQEIAVVLWSAVTPRSIKSQDLDCGRRCLTDDLVLDLRPCEAPLASRSIRRSCLSSCLYSSDGVERSVGAIVPAKDDL